MLGKNCFAIVVSIFTGLCLLGSLPKAFAEGVGSTPVVLDGPYPAHGYSWENNDLGITDEVPEPWRPIVYSPNEFSVWGRNFEIGSGILPKQITTQGKKIFARSPALILKINGKSVSLGRLKIHKKKGNRVTFTSRYNSGNFKVIAEGSLEYDGLWKIQLRIEPVKGSVKIDELTLELPFESSVAEACSRYLDYDYLEQVVSLDDTADSYGDLSKPITLGFNPAVWIGNQQVGLEWICETDAGWSAASAQAREEVIDIRPQGGATQMTVKVISKPLRVKTSYQFTFALYPTPIKPLPKDWRLKRLVSEDTLPGNFDTKSLDVYSIIWPGVTPVRYPGLPVMEGSPPDEFQDPALRPIRRLKDPKKHLRETRRRIKEKGIKFIPYGALNFMPATLPEGEWKDYASSWRTHHSTKKGGGTNRTWGRAQGIPKDGTLTILHISPVTKSFRDFIVWQYVTAIEKEDIDGLYFDAGAPNVMAVNLNLPYAKHVRRGGKYYPFFAERRLMRRLWVACKSRKKDFFITGHNPKMPAIITGFFDLSLTGEALAHSFFPPSQTRKNPKAFKPDYSIFSTALFSHGYAHEAIGTINMFLPMIIKEYNRVQMQQNPAQLERYTRTLFARTLLYNIPIYAANMDLKLFRKTGVAYSHFDWLANATFFAPRQAKQFLNRPVSKLKVSLYLNAQKNEIFMVVSNLQKTSTQETIALNLEQLKRRGVVLGDPVEFVDPVSQTVLNLKPGHGVAQVQIPGNDYRLFIVR